MWISEAAGQLAYQLNASAHIEEELFLILTAIVPAHFEDNLDHYNFQHNLIGKLGTLLQIGVYRLMIQERRGFPWAFTWITNEDIEEFYDDVL